MPNILGIAIALVVLTAVLSTVERLFPARSKRWRRAGMGTDIIFWFFTPVVTRPITYAAVVVAVLAVATLAGVRLDGEHIRAYLDRDTAIKQQPVGVQAIEALIMLDFIAYWMHRLFHGNSVLWPFHAVHHSSTEVDWLSSVRVHPVNDLVTRAAQAVPLVALGFNPTILAAAVPFFTFYAIFVHANVPWGYGRLRYVVASPAFHRWHHTSETEGLNKNFAGLLPLWDVAFGTFYMPARQPEQFGLSGYDVPSGFVGQIVQPLRRRTPARAVAGA
jgi:sterol desaturase/sphingolipid hydroxylase (fatty acid hydroxylase superfamily)